MSNIMKNAALLGVIALGAISIAGFTYYKFDQTQKARLAAQQDQAQQEGVAVGEPNGGVVIDLGDENDYLDQALSDLEALSQ
jgi:uncharacterized protein HemX